MLQVTLRTVHSSKGLEAVAVFVVGMDKNSWWSANAKEDDEQVSDGVCMQPADVLVKGFDLLSALVLMCAACNCFLYSDKHCIRQHAWCCALQSDMLCCASVICLCDQAWTLMAGCYAALCGSCCCEPCGACLVS